MTVRSASTSLGLTVITAALLAAHAARARADGPVTVTTDSGPVRGVASSTDHRFLGIPYAKPPVGALRFKPPQAPTPWTTPRDATQFGSSCPQNPGPFGIASTNEDCLFLNVYTPRRVLNAPLRRDPVLVWIHPGAFQSGEGHDYDPRAFVEKGLVVVTLNYRLGALGFLAHQALTGESPDATSGNYGLLDQQAALRWVKRNIARFGGDPGRVTLAGESAGGVSVHAHMVAPSSAGLFHRAIVQSGAYELDPPPLAALEQHGTAFAASAAVGCAADQSAACLRSKPVTALLAGPGPGAIGWLPSVDGELLPQTFTQAFATGTFNRVPVIEGSTHDEFTLFVALLFDLRGVPVTPAIYPTAIGIVLGVSDPVVISAVVAQYPLANYSSAGAALAAVGTDAVFACNARLAVQLLAQHVPVWSYEFDDPDAPMGTLPPVSFPYLAFHGSELQYLFGVRRNFPPPPMNADQLALSEAMSHYWTNFTRIANPNGLQTPFWIRYLPAADRIQLLTPPTPEQYTGFAADHKCAFWAALAGGG